MNLLSTDFELFHLAPAFALERADLDQRWKDLQRLVHPDRHASDAQTQRQAVQWSVRVNEAYQRLKDPIKRAAYLCELHGVPVGAQTNTQMPGAFLMQQMAWREALEEANSLADLEALWDETQASRRDLLAAMQISADQAADFQALAGQVRAMMFVQRFAQDVQERLDQTTA